MIVFKNEVCNVIDVDWSAYKISWTGLNYLGWKTDKTVFISVFLFCFVFIDMTVATTVSRESQVI